MIKAICERELETGITLDEGCHYRLISVGYEYVDLQDNRSNDVVSNKIISSLVNPFPFNYGANFSEFTSFKVNIPVINPISISSSDMEFACEFASLILTDSHRKWPNLERYRFSSNLYYEVECAHGRFHIPIVTLKNFYKENHCKFYNNVIKPWLRFDKDNQIIPFTRAELDGYRGDKLGIIAAFNMLCSY